MGGGGGGGVVGERGVTKKENYNIVRMKHSCAQEIG